MAGPLLRTRRNRPVFTFRNVLVVDSTTNAHCWLAKPLPPFPAGVNVTSAPGLELLLVRASPPFLRTGTLEVVERQSSHSVDLFSLGFSHAVARNGHC